MILHYHIEGGDFVNAGKASSAVKRVLKQLDVPSIKGEEGGYCPL